MVKNLTFQNFFCTYLLCIWKPRGKGIQKFSVLCVHALPSLYQRCNVLALILACFRFDMFEKTLYITQVLGPFSDKDLFFFCYRVSSSRSLFVLFFQKHFRNLLFFNQTAISKCIVNLNFKSSQIDLEINRKMVRPHNKREYSI